MKLGIIINANVFDNLDFIKDLRYKDFYIVVVYQLDYHNILIPTDVRVEFLKKLSKLREKGYVNDTYFHKNISIDYAENTLFKRNSGLSRLQRCTHHLSIDGFERYDMNSLVPAWETVKRDGYTDSTCEVEYYFKGKLVQNKRTSNPFYVPFIALNDGRQYGITKYLVDNVELTKTLPSAFTSSFLSLKSIVCKNILFSLNVSELSNYLILRNYQNIESVIIAYQRNIPYLIGSEGLGEYKFAI